MSVPSAAPSATMSADGTRALVIIGAGGHARVLIDVLKRAGRAVAGIADTKESLYGSMVDGVQVLGNDDIIYAQAPASLELVNGLGNNVRLNDSGLLPRAAVFNRFKDKGYDFAAAVSPDAVVSDAAQLGEGAQIITRAVVHPGSVLGVNVIINTAAQVDHGCRIGAHSHIGPGAVLAGDVAVGEFCHIGARAVIRQGIAIGDGAVVGAGAVVVDNVPPGVTVVGNPARPVNG